MGARGTPSEPDVLVVGDDLKDLELDVRKASPIGVHERPDALPAVRAGGDIAVDPVLGEDLLHHFLVVVAVPPVLDPPAN